MASWLVAFTVVALFGPVAWAQSLPASDGPTEIDDPADLEDLDSLDGLDALDELDAQTGTGQTPGVAIRLFRGFGAADYRAFPRDRQGPRRDHQARLEAQLELQLALPASFTVLLRPWFLVDALDTTLLRYEPLEAYLEFDGGPFDVLAGQFIESWGIADAFNPLDVLNRRDLAVNLLDPVVRGELGGRLRVRLPDLGPVGEPTLAAYVIPVFRRTPFPTGRNRFSLEQPGVAFRPGQANAPKTGQFDAVMWAGRVTHTISSPAISADLQYIVGRGPEDFPLLVPEVDARGVSLVPNYYGAWAFGGGFRAVPGGAFLSKHTLKAELVYKRPFRLVTVPLSAGARLPERYFQYVLGIDRQFVRVFAGRDQVTVTVEYMGELGAHDVAHDLRPFTSDIALRLFWEGGDFSRSAVELRAVVDVRLGELITEAVIGRQLRFVHDDLRLELSGQYLRAAPTREGSLLSYLPDNSNVRVRLQMDF